MIVDRALALAELDADGDVLGKTRRVHFVGIGGIGMSGIAELLANLGYVVSGSDARRSAVTDRLRDARASRSTTGTPRRTSATRTSWWSRRRCGRRTRRCVEARRRGIPVIPRAEMLAELMRLRFAHRGGRRARQDDDDVDDRAGARAGRARSRRRSSAAGSARSAATRGSGAAS